MGNSTFQFKTKNCSFEQLLPRPLWLHYSLRNNQRKNVLGNNGRRCKGIRPRILSMPTARRCWQSLSSIRITNHYWKDNQLLHFDYLYNGESSNNQQEAIILKNDLSGYWFLRACSSANVETTAEVLIKFCATFVLVLLWLFDQSSHFKIKSWDYWQPR